MAEAEKRRYWELDFIRGFCILLMVIDHFLYASAAILPAVWQWCGKEFFTSLNEFALNYWDNFAHSIAHYVVVAMFMLVCGISCTLSRSNLARGIKAAIVAVAITLVTWLGDSFFDMQGGFIIRFGVIHMYAVAILLYWLLSLPARYAKQEKLTKALKLLPALTGAIILVVFFARWGRFEILTGYNFNRYIRLMSTISVNGSKTLKNLMSMLIELRSGGLGSADYFPIIPYAMLVLLGSLIGHLFYKSPQKSPLKRLEGKWNAPISFLGRHTLLIYLVHQIVIIAIFYSIGSLYYIF